MTLTLTLEKKKKIKDLAEKLCTVLNNTVRLVASFLENLTASFEAVPYGRLNYRHIEFCKIQALKAILMAHVP